MSQVTTHAANPLTDRIALIYMGNCGGEFGRRNAQRIPEEFGKTRAVDLKLIDTIVLNTESKSLARSVSEIKPTKHLLLGPICRKGEGAGFDAEKGKEAFDESKEDLKALFTDANGKSLYRIAIIVHAALKGTGGGGALPLGQMLRDEIGVEFVMYQSVRPSAGECSTPQRRKADERIQAIVDDGFLVTEIDNGNAYERADDSALMEEVYRMLDDDQPRAIQAALYVIANPGAVDVSDFKNWIAGSGKKGEGRRLMTGYASFKISEYNDPENTAAAANFESELKKAFDTWAFNFKYRSPTSALVVYYGNEFWNKGRKVKLENELQNFANRWIIPGDEDDFYPILGGQYTTDESAGDYAFLAIMACGPKEDDAFKNKLQQRQEEALQPAQLQSPIALRAAVTSEVPPAPIPLPEDVLPQLAQTSPEVEAEVSEEETAMTAFMTGLEQKKAFLLSQLVGKATVLAKEATSKISAVSVETFLASSELQGKSSEEIVYVFSDQLLTIYSIAGKFTAEEYLRIKKSEKSDTLTDWATKKDLEVLFAKIDQYEDRFVPILEARLAMYDQFPEDLIQKHLARKRTTKDAPAPDLGYKVVEPEKPDSAKGNRRFLSKIMPGTFGNDHAPKSGAMETAQ